MVVVVCAAVVFIAEVLALWLITSVLCDAVHALLHLSLRARAPWSWLGLFHKSHHRFLDEDLCFHDERFWPQVLLHQVPELVIRCAMSIAVGVVLELSVAVIVLQIVLFVWSLLETIVARGRDREHSGVRPVPPPAPGFVVDGGYHALHHAFPEHFLGAQLSVIDIVFGRLLPVRGRAAVVVGGSGYCFDLAQRLRADGARVVHTTVDDLDDSAFVDVGILVLGHGADDRGTGAYEAVIARALKYRDSVVPLDVWAVGDAPAWSARAPMFTDRVILRRLVRGPMLGADKTLFLLRRGLRQL